MKQDDRLRAQQAKRSLDDINRSVQVPGVYETSFFQKFLAYSGPGALVAVGYMDPGNWLTALEGGSKYHDALLSVLLMTILVAMFMQSLSIKLGVVARLDLAQAIAAFVPKWARICLWLINEAAMMATDMTGVVGTAIALKLLFGLPLMWGMLLTIADVLVVLFFLRFGIRRIELIVLASILTVGIIFGIEVLRAHPSVGGIVGGFVPHTEILTNHGMLVLSLGIMGATIMPHNIYLHSSLAQSRRYDEHIPAQVTEALRFGKWDSNVHLVAAFLINALLLVLGATLFYNVGGHVTAFQGVYNGLKNPAIVGGLASPIMSTLFAFALLITGLISSIASTLAGQIVMEGYLNIQMPLWERRLLTRAVTLIPIMIIGFIMGFSEHNFEQVIVYAQVALSIALPFTLFPLVALTDRSDLMGDHVNSPGVRWVGYLLTGLITLLNLQLIVSVFVP
ncbi:Nramp family divalent metal transporter [Lacticaseibacillus casei]|uniref:Nramp family divalent metal transporter n=1 Tax=Lacticaseibacillus TaxID=2759736 RepID=UPI000665A728|nr:MULTISPECIES: Nramp family divalent metal transporter [Lacticaseibacillus]QVI37380.1 Nramp family divalent metal transporter [Lacticaseibacillus casei]QXG59171.1 Nramp family divalent metal transporter [Lacticaseibacillus casei]WFB41079.1 Nramp family divalent metal transporter [Lacticaseibacillus huelsenbergensis]